MALRITVLLAAFGGVRLMGAPPPAPPLGSWNRALVSLVDNGYKGLVLAIAEEVPEDLTLINETMVSSVSMLKGCRPDVNARTT